jgi:hypothetical protein
VNEIVITNIRPASLVAAFQTGLIGIKNKADVQVKSLLLCFIVFMVVMGLVFPVMDHYQFNGGQFNTFSYGALFQQFISGYWQVYSVMFVMLSILHYGFKLGGFHSWKFGIGTLLTVWLLPAGFSALFEHSVGFRGVIESVFTRQSFIEFVVVFYVSLYGACFIHYMTGKAVFTLKKSLMYCGLIGSAIGIIKVIGNLSGAEL